LADGFEIPDPLNMLPISALINIFDLLVIKNIAQR
jgi:hypothetical protein